MNCILLLNPNFILIVISTVIHILVFKINVITIPE